MNCSTFLHVALVTCFLVSAVHVIQADDSNCSECVAFGKRHRPNQAFTHRDGCREYNCDCACSGKWDCPGERIKDVCKPACSTCWAGGQIREGNKPFQFTEECFQYNCLCKCDGGWDCPKENTIDICRTNLTTGCYFCDVGGERRQGNSHFKFVNGCIEYDCVCKCDGGWDCPGERAVDKCNTNPDTGCYQCDVHGKKYDGNSHFSFTKGCIEYSSCVCNCDGGWNCPGERAKDLCRTNRTSGCYYCEADEYLYQGNDQFELVRDCYKYTCECGCDGGWTCANSVGQYVCDSNGRLPDTSCQTCSIDGNRFRGNSRFFYQRGCIRYLCTCDCAGRHYCSGNEAHITCEDTEYEYIASLSYGSGSGSVGVAVHGDHTRAPRQVREDCTPCVVNGKTFSPFENLEQESGCNTFYCTCNCNGQIDCPPDRIVNRCRGPSSSGGVVSTQFSSSSSQGGGISGGGVGISGTGGGFSGSTVDVGTGSTGVSVCTECTHLGVTYGNAPFEFERGCFRYFCNCRCNGSIDCPKSVYTCAGQKECITCDAGDGVIVQPEKDFELTRGCITYPKCRCKCDGGWSCGDGIFTCDVCQGCKIDGRAYAGNSSFQLTRGCDLYQNCNCGCDRKWSCSGDIKDLCGTCRKCKIGLDYYRGDTSFMAQVDCTRYRSCQCNCDGSYMCKQGLYTCDNRGDTPVEGACTDCVHGNRRYRPGQSFDYQDGCSQYRACECKCGTTFCREVEDTCGDCRSCNINGTEYRGGSKFSHKVGCRSYSECDCFCNGDWKCYGAKAVDTCNECRKCNVEENIYDPYTTFLLQRKCWKYQCFCGCNGETRCPKEIVVNTCTTPDVCRRCNVEGREIRGNTHFNYKYNGMDMTCRCNCDGSHVCVAEWKYITTDLTITGSGIGGGFGTCQSCNLDGRTYFGNSNFTISRNGINLDCQCSCNGGYYCFGIHNFEGSCRSCSVYGQKIGGDSSFSVVYNGFKLGCQCSCDGGYVCIGADGTTVITCLNNLGFGCLTSRCGQCVVDGTPFNGRDQFGTIYKGQQLTCDCGCDGSYYCEGSGGIIISCVNGRCVELGCTSCRVWENEYPGDSKFAIIYRGLQLDCNCQCGGNYQCFGAKGELVVTCVDSGIGCLGGRCMPCSVKGRQYAGVSTFRYDYKGIDMLCTCACDSSYYCKGTSELIEISCVGGVCNRIGCGTCNLFGQSYNGASSFNIIYGGLKLNCECSCDSTYRCSGSTGEVIIQCFGLNQRGCVSTTCNSCVVNGREYAGRSTFRSSYKGIDVMCTCGCDSSSFCVGITTSIEVTCIGGTCTRIGCKECSIFGKEYHGSSQFDIYHLGLKLTCDCDCSGGYVCRGSDGGVIITCINGIGPGCIQQQCRSCVVDGRRFQGRSEFNFQYNGIDMKCTCSCDSSYYCVGVREKIEISCINGVCNPIGCKACNIYGQQHPGASQFNLVYGGLLLDCTCNCDGGYFCQGQGGTTIIRCRNGRTGPGCLSLRCDSSCRIDGRDYAAGSTFRYVYNGIDVTCQCGCDGSVVCTGVSIKITLSCLGGICTPIGCQDCRIFGQVYNPLSTFDIIYQGRQVSCKCNCAGGYECSSGDISIICRSSDGRDCLPQLCNTCTLNGREYQGLSVFKHEYNNIDFSCTCGCDGGIFCQGVTELIELTCIGGTCTPIGCQACRIFGNTYPALSGFTLYYQGLKLTCECSCLGGYICRGRGGETIVDCGPGGRDCITGGCRSCFKNGREIKGGATYSDVYMGFDMKCWCACDGSSYCKGVKEIIEITCIGGACNPIGCQTCGIFGIEYKPFSKFNMVYNGLLLTCDCACDSSYICKGSTGEVIKECLPGRTCFPSVCRNCIVDGQTYNSRSTFDYRYQDIDMKCTCGCDGTSYCVGVKIKFEISCIGDTCSPVNCRNCNIFGRDYPALQPFDLVYQGVSLDCKCSCDSSYICYGKGDEEVVKCRTGREPACFANTCRDCYVDGKRYGSRSTFSYDYKGIDMKCTCGCDGSSFCKGVKEIIEISCIGNTCSLRDCKTCNIFGRDYEAIVPFSIIYQGVSLNCRCSCDSSYVCSGSSGEVIVECAPGRICLTGQCNDCIVDGRRYSTRSEFPYQYKDIDMKCQCGCDGSAYCEGVKEIFYVSCIGGNCSPIGCIGCNIFGRKYSGASQFPLVYKGIQMQCDCACDSSYVCKGSSTDENLICEVGKTCVPARCRRCRVNGRRYEGQSTFSFNYQGVPMSCICGCDGSFYCEGTTTDVKYSCNRNGNCVLIGGCLSCNLFGKQYAAATRTEFVYNGYFMTCTCACDSSYKCIGVKGEVIVACGPGGRDCLTNRCGSCRIDGQTYPGMTEFDTVNNGRNMRCTCGCDGSYFCRCTDDDSEMSCTRNGICTNIGCSTCLSDGRTRQAYEEFDKIYDGIRTNCLCACDGSYRCKGAEVKIVITCRGEACNVVGCRSCLVNGREYASGSDYEVSGSGSIRRRCRCKCDGTSSCTNVQRPVCTSCVIDGKTYPGHSRHRIWRQGNPFICDCLCSGEQTCTPERPICRECEIGGKSYAGRTEFDAMLEGENMRCSCDCRGGYTCKGGSKTCTNTGCTDNCRACVIEGVSHSGNTNFEAIISGNRMQCSCDCRGGFSCKGEYRICTNTGCVDECRQCVIEGVSHTGNTNFEAIISGNRMQCTCDCKGGYSCKGEYRICTNTGCVDQCRPCVIEGVSHTGNTNFGALISGNRMQCTCDCKGGFSCKGEYRICTNTGCVDDCRPCVIDGVSHTGNTNFDAIVFGNRMKCTCDCKGGYSCKGEYKTCTNTGCVDECRQCVIEGISHTGNTNFGAVISGNRMQCTCDCKGGFTCKGEYRICTNTGCVDDCRQCVIDGVSHTGNTNFEAIVFGNRMQCSCDCKGGYSCKGEYRICTNTGCVDECRPCVIEGVSHTGNTNFGALISGNRMQCSCDCKGGYSCKGEYRICTNSGCVDECRPCVIDGSSHTGNTNFEAIVSGNRMQCSCDCKGGYSCKGEYRICTNSGCVDECRPCVIDGSSHTGNTNFEAIVSGNRMQCSCDCKGGYSCKGEYRICTNTGCVDECRTCVIDGVSHTGNTNFEAIVSGNRMQCSCDCKGGYSCKGEYRICTNTGCVDDCRQCVIDGVSHTGNTNFEAMVSGNRMQCSCDCRGGYSCKGEYRICTNTGCVDECRQCVIEGVSHTGNTNFGAIVSGNRMQCTCDCRGGYSCKGEYMICTNSGCVDECRPCVIEGVSHSGNTKFDAMIFGNRMRCSCDCKGGYSCESDRRVCTPTGCVDRCQPCLIEGRSRPGNTEFNAVAFGEMMRCSCDCSGGYICKSDLKTCSSVSGCVDSCRQCNIDGRKRKGNTEFNAVVFGEMMRCSCDCSGGYVCKSDQQTCSSVTGCVDKCRQCTIDGRKHTGNTNFEAMVSGTRMQCSCDCTGSYRCTSETQICTSSSGCIENCPGCTIEGVKYPGNKRFEIFHRGYDVNMECDCKCGGSYTCRGEKEVTTCVGANCPDQGGCIDCVIGGRTFSGGTTFETIMDNIRMQCSCECNGGYKCVGGGTDCRGPNCPIRDQGCQNCVIGTNTYNGGTKFQIDQDDTTMHCECDCDSSFVCRGKKTQRVCIGANCNDNQCRTCEVGGRQIEGGTRFETMQDGIRMDCTCSCNGNYKCEGYVNQTVCTGPNCQTNGGCRLCIIDDRTYSGNTRFSYRSGQVFSCSCFCDGSYECVGENGMITSCVGSNCAAEKCKQCRLDNDFYQMDARFRLRKNNLIMNCVCECDGAYRCFSMTGSCSGPDCDNYGCKSCTINGRQYAGNSEFETTPGTICTCDCTGQYSCRLKSILVTCRGEGCGSGGCNRCIVDGQEYPGNSRFQFTKYGLLMQCACNCDSSYTCRGYQIISRGEEEVDLGCKYCEMDGRRYIGNTRFQAMVKGVRSVCSCSCDGEISCSGSTQTCRSCNIGNQRYASNSDFTLARDGNIIRCRCNCNGDFICEGKNNDCRDGSCTIGGCNDCLIFGHKYKGDSRFTTDAGGIRMLCECYCNGGYSCKGYRHVTNILLPPAREQKTECAKCYVANNREPVKDKFTIRRGCFEIECICDCSGEWECPDQRPKYVCDSRRPGTGNQVSQSRYTIAGNQVFASSNADLASSSSSLIYADTQGSTVFGSQSSGCTQCEIRGQTYDSYTNFVLQDGCLRFVCQCNCDGQWNCSSVQGSDCTGPLDPFESKSEKCVYCNTNGTGSFPPNQDFTYSDKCYRYSCRCNCDGSWECPAQLTVKTCDDTSGIYNPQLGTCRQCTIGRSSFAYGQTFEHIEACIRYTCDCKCDGSYNCPASTAVRVCRTGSGSSGRVTGTGSNTQTHQRTYVNIRPAETGYTDRTSSSQTGGNSGVNTRRKGTSVSVVSSQTGSGTSSSRGNTYNTDGGHGVNTRRKGTSVSVVSSQAGSETSSSRGNTYNTDGGQSSYSVSRETRTEVVGSGTSGGGSSYRSSSSSGGSSRTGGSYSSSSSSTSGGSRAYTGGACNNCVVNGTSLSGGREFTYRSGCTEYSCECYCNGTYVCPPEDSTDFCKLGEYKQARESKKKLTRGCTVGNRTYKTKLFSYTKGCMKFICRCKNNGQYNCDARKTKKVC